MALSRSNELGIRETTGSCHWCSQPSTLGLAYWDLHAEACDDHHEQLRRHMLTELSAWAQEQVIWTRLEGAREPDAES